MARTVQQLYGQAALEALVAQIYNQVRDEWSKRSEETEKNDLEYMQGLFNKDAHEFTINEAGTQRLDVTVTRCIHADVFRAFNAADIGELLICQTDFAVVEGYNPRIRLVRPETCMQGNVCRFVFQI